MVQHCSIWLRFVGIVMLLMVGFSNSSSMVNATTGATLFLNGEGYLRVSNAPALNPTTGITLEAWVRRADVNRCETIVGKQVNSSFWFGFCTGPLRFFTNGVDSWRDGTHSVAAGVWTHVAVTFDGTTRRYYLNGLLDYEADTPGLLPVNDAPLTIGADADATYPFSGNIADVRLWRTARTQAAIQRNMVRLLDQGDPDLVATWHLEGGATDIFGRYNASPVGAVTFTGLAAPPVAHDPILIPQLPSAPNVDGLCNIDAGEYQGLLLPIWYGDNWDPENLAWSYLGATDTDFYLCMRHFPLATPIVTVNLDPNGSGDVVPQSDDYLLVARQDGTTRTSQGNGAGGYVPVELPANSYRAQFTVGEVDASAEFRIARSLLGAPNAIFRLQFMQFHNNPSLPDASGWPLDFSEANPARWPRFQIASTALFIPDSDNPTIQVRHAPQPIIRAADQVVIRANATDMVDLASMDIYVDGSVPVRSCIFTFNNDTAGACEYQPTLALGRHTYYAVATDQRGHRTASTRTSIFVQADGQSPQIVVDHAPRTPDTGQNFTINAQATDASGIRSITIRTDSPPYEQQNCPFAGVTTSANCTLAITPGARRVIRYVVHAVDNEGLTANSPLIPVLIGNRVAAATPDSDGDGLIDLLERALGTSITNIDSDFDALQDGWEVLGLTFPGSSDPPLFSAFIDLPALGANPLVKDLFVQYDYERGARVEPMVWPYIINRFRDRRITLHVTENERPRPTERVTSTLSAELAATLYFPPKLNWTHHYVYSHHYAGRSATWHYVTININTNNCPLSTSDPQSDPACGGRDANAQTYVVMHELGHDLGLGHGGHVAERARLLDQGDTISYGPVRGGGWNDTNLKPNYASIMNYRYSSAQLCYNPGLTGDPAGRWLSFYDYGTGQLPNLNEGALAERADSLFPQQLARQPCTGATAGYVPTIAYACVDQDNIRWAIYSDGTRARARVRMGSTWETTGLPILTQPGIDWNCDGQISDSFVSENLNGDGGENGWGDGSTSELLNDYADWPNLPFGAGAGCVIVRERPVGFPTSYLDMISNTTCRIGTASVQSAQATVRQRAFASLPHVHTVDAEPVPPSTEFCNLLDDDNDEQIDEGCNDQDGDGAVDLLDACPQTPDPAQIDQNNNYLGDACESPVVTALTATKTMSGTVALTWTATLSDVMGFAIYRQPLDGDGTAELLGNGYQAANVTHYGDLLLSAGRYRYSVRAVNLLGIEGEAAAVEVDLSELTLQKNFLPLISR